MTEPSSTPDDDSVETIAFEEFRDGLPLGRFRVIVNPELAQRFVAQRVVVVPLTIAIVGVGIASALAGYLIAGLALVAAGIVLRRAVRRQAAKILLHLASQHAGTYDEATAHGVMEVRRA